MAKTTQPANLRYSKTHEWARVEGDIAYIGISDYAQKELGDVVYVELPWDEIGVRELRAEDHFGDVDSSKTASELFTPVSGTLTQVNDALKANPEVVNSDPYGDGWMLAIRMSDPNELDAMLDADAYTAFIEGGGH